MVVVGIERQGSILRNRLAGELLQEDDQILALGTRLQLEEIASHSDFIVREIGLSAVRQLQEHWFLDRHPERVSPGGIQLGVEPYGRTGRRHRWGN